jgi:hypothetical protein
MMNDDDDLPDTDPVTPADTPSALLKLGLAVCPKCEGTGFLFINGHIHEVKTEECDLCEGGKRVTIEKAKQFGEKK